MMKLFRENIDSQPEAPKKADNVKENAATVVDDSVNPKERVDTNDNDSGEYNAGEAKQDANDANEKVQTNDGQEHDVDDNGNEIYDEDGNLKPNQTFALNGVEYKTDDKGKIYSVDGERVGLSNEEKALIKHETGWSDEIIDHIESMDQYEIYKNANLHEAEVNGRKCLIKEIDMDYVDSKTGMTNRELMEKGRSPIDSKTGEKIELHHMGQDPNGPFAELCENSEHGDGNHSTLHTKLEDSWRNNSELNNQYQTEKRNHWKSRAEEV